MIDSPTESSSKQTPYLVVLKGKRIGSGYLLTKLPVVIGREADIAPDPEDKNISRRHAIIQSGPVGLGIVDNHSTNGTLVNGKPVQAHPLKNGDKITIGNTEFQFVLLESDDSEKLAGLNYRDTQTGLFNKARFDETLALAFGAAELFERPFGVLLIEMDLPEEKSEQDIEDRLVVELAELLSSLLLEDQELYRIDTIRFAVMLYGPSARFIADFGELIRQSVEVFQYGDGDQPHPVTASVGVTFLGKRPTEDTDVQTYYTQVLDQLNEARAAGGNKVCGQSTN